MSPPPPSNQKCPGAGDDPATCCGEERHRPRLRWAGAGGAQRRGGAVGGDAAQRRGVGPTWTQGPLRGFTHFESTHKTHVSERFYPNAPLPTIAGLAPAGSLRLAAGHGCRWCAARACWPRRRACRSARGGASSTTSDHLQPSLLFYKSKKEPVFFVYCSSFCIRAHVTHPPTVAGCRSTAWRARSS